MTRASRCNALLTLAAALAFLAAGCGSSSDCTLTPDLATTPAPCTLPPQTSVVVKVQWCNCGAVTVCKVTNESSSGIFQLEPQVNSCDASCPINPTGCAGESVACTFQSPDVGSYHLYVISGQGFEDVSMTVMDGANSTCG